MEEKLIALVEEYPCLYNTTQDSYRRKDFKGNAWAEIAREMGMPLQHQTCQCRIHHLRVMLMLHWKRYQMKQTNFNHLWQKSSRYDLSAVLEKLQQSSEKIQEDPDELFLLSMAHEVKTMSVEKRWRFKVGVMNLINEIKYSIDIT
ncbi:uncharacterized protein LOC144422074 isoform X2 [Styela clava]